MVDPACGIHSLSPRPAARRALRSTIANMFRTRNPSLSSERALLAANVALQIVKAMRTLSQPDVSERS